MIFSKYANKGFHPCNFRPAFLHCLMPRFFIFILEYHITQHPLPSLNPASTSASVDLDGSPYRIYNPADGASVPRDAGVGGYQDSVDGFDSGFLNFSSFHLYIVT